MILSSKTELVLESYLRPLNRGVPDELLLLTYYVYLSRLLCYNRVRIKLRSDYLYPNIYAMSFAKSGIGKDRAIHYVERLFENAIECQRQRSKDYVAARQLEIEQYLSQKDENGKSKFTERQKQRYRDEWEPYSLVEENADGTIEGLYSIRQEMQNAGFGSTHYTNDEFIDYISTNNSTRMESISFLKGVYEKGNNKVKVIKSQKSYEEVKDVPCTMLVHSSMSGLVNEESTMQIFKNLFERGFARRCIISVPENKVYERMTTEEIRHIEESAVDVAELIKPMIGDLYNKTYAIPPEYKTITLTDEAEDMYVQYGERLLEEESKNTHQISDSEGSERTDRHRRALRLAACIASFEHQDSLIITKEDYKIAVSQVEYFAKQFTKVFNLERVSDAEKVYAYIEKNQDKENINKTKIKKQSFAPKGAAQAVSWLQNVLLDLTDLCHERGKELKEVSGEKNSTYFEIQDIETNTEAEIKTFNPADTICTFSFTGSRKSHPTEEYQKFQRPFLSLHNDLKKGYSYSPAIFKDGYRKTSNIIEMGNCIMIDIDDGLSLEDAKKHVDHIQALIVTTNSHQKKKGELIADRYRIIIPCQTPLAPSIDYKVFIQNILKHFSLDKTADMGATVDQARYFKPSPGDAVHWYSPGTALFDWRPYDATTAPNVRQPSKNNYLPTGKLPRNARPNATFTDKSGKTYSWDDFRNLSESETKPVRCIFPENHANGDKHPSAFIGRHHEGTLMFKCSACQSLIFEK